MCMQLQLDFWPFWLLDSSDNTYLWENGYNQTSWKVLSEYISLLSNLHFWFGFDQSPCIIRFETDRLFALTGMLWFFSFMEGIDVTFEERIRILKVAIFWLCW